jgi:hypothetical protein
MTVNSPKAVGNLADPNPYSRRVVIISELMFSPSNSQNSFESVSAPVVRFQRRIHDAFIMYINWLSFSGL